MVESDFNVLIKRFKERPEIAMRYGVDVEEITIEYFNEFELSLVNNLIDEYITFWKGPRLELVKND